MPKGASESYALLNVTLLDGSEHMEPQRGMAVITEGSKISWVGPAACAQVPSGAREMDMGAPASSPGLVSIHVHLCRSGKPVSAGNAGDLMRRLNNAPGRAIVRRVLAGSARQQLASGVTTVRGAGDPLFGDLAVRDAIESGRLEGPRLVATGTGITVPGGHGAGLFAQVANVPEEAAAMVRDLFARKADVIKLFITGGVFDATEPGEPGVVRMPLEVARAACVQAHELGLPVMAHVESTEGVRQALLAGVDTIEHGAKMTPEIVGLYRGSAGTQLAGRPASVTCTISPALPFVKLPPEKTHSTDDAEGQRGHRLRGHHRERPPGPGRGHPRRPGHGLLMPLRHAVRHVARAGVLLQVRGRDARLCAPHGHAGQRRPAGPGRRLWHRRGRHGRGPCAPAHAQPSDDTSLAARVVECSPAAIWSAGRESSACQSSTPSSTRSWPCRRRPPGMPFAPVPNGALRPSTASAPLSPFRYVFMSGQLRDARHPGAVVGMKTPVEDAHGGAHGSLRKVPT